MTSDTLLCPECGQKVTHTKGYLTEHSRNIQRGELITGSTFCDGSNSRPPMNLKTVTFAGMCHSCMNPVREESTETFPGSLAQYGGIKTVQCPHCGPEADICGNCGHQLHEVDDEQTTLNTALCEPTDEDETALWMMLQAPAMTLDLAKAARDHFSLPITDNRVEELFKANALAALGASKTVTVKMWVDKNGFAQCDDGQEHQHARRPASDRPVLLTDTHVIAEPLDD